MHVIKIKILNKVNVKVLSIISHDCGGWTTEFSGMNFFNVMHKTVHRWSWDIVMKDLDGSLSDGQAGNVVVSRTNITDGDRRCYLDSSYKNGAICSNTTDWIRFSFNNFDTNEKKFFSE